MPETALSRGAARSDSGFTLIEVCLAMTIAAVAIGGLMAAAVSADRLQVQTRSYGLASRSFQQLHESFREGDLDARVAELKAAPDIELGTVTLTVSFPEQLLVDQLGAPVPAGWRYRDLDGDGEVELDAASTADSSLVPVSVEARWAGGVLRSRFLVTEK